MHFWRDNFSRRYVIRCETYSIWGEVFSEVHRVDKTDLGLRDGFDETVIEPGVANERLVWPLSLI